jgi:adenylate cyclase
MRGLVVLAVLPLVILTLLRFQPKLDAHWEDHRAHFWLVLSASLISMGLGYSVFVAARRRRDARLLLVSLAFIASAGFLGLHALATPDVLLGTNPGFELATPLGLLFGGIFVAASGISLSQPVYQRLIRNSRWLLAGLGLVMLIWGVVSLAQLPPLNNPLQSEQLNGWQTALGALGVILYAVGALGYFRLYRQRRARFVFAMAFSFALLAEAMVVIAFAQAWQISWWEWHTLMLAAFLLIATVARQEWGEERFSAIYLDETLAGTKEASIIFADLQSYTAYAEQAAPAEIGEMLNAYFGRLIPLMEKMGGDVHQIIGDAIMVIFNKEGDQPEHAPLAGRAALAFQHEAASIAEMHPDWPRFRVGVNSGEVLAGVIGAERGHRKHGVVGDTVNLAARLEGQAPVGEVVIGAGTYDRLPEGSRAEVLTPLVVKGKTEPVSAYILRDIPTDP